MGIVVDSCITIVNAVPVVNELIRVVGLSLVIEWFTDTRVPTNGQKCRCFIHYSSHDSAFLIGIIPRPSKALSLDFR